MATRLDPNASAERTTVALAPDAPGAAERSSVRLADLPAPVVTLTAPSPGSKLTVGTAATWSATVDPVDGTAVECEFEIGSAPMHAGSGADAGGGVWSASLTPLLMHVGSNVVRARARNSRGRYGYSSDVAVTVTADPIEIIMALNPAVFFYGGDGSSTYLTTYVENVSGTTRVSVAKDLAAPATNAVTWATPPGYYGARGPQIKMVGDRAKFWFDRSDVGLQARIATSNFQKSTLTEVFVWNHQVESASTVYQPIRFACGTDWPGALYLEFLWGWMVERAGSDGRRRISKAIGSKIGGYDQEAKVSWSIAWTAEPHCYTVRYEGGAATDAERARIWYDGAERTDLTHQVWPRVPEYIAPASSAYVDIALNYYQLGGGSFTPVMRGDLQLYLLFYDALNAATIAVLHKAIRQLCPDWTAGT